MFVLVVVANASSFDELISRQLYWLAFSYEKCSHRMCTIDKLGSFQISQLTSRKVLSSLKAYSLADHAHDGDGIEDHRYKYSVLR